MEKRHIFMLNPAAGKGKALEIKEKVKKLPREIQKNIEIYESKEMLHLEVLALKIAKRATTNNPIRIYACGGDGTLNEVLNGIIGYENVELGVIPMGTGNDFIRNFASKDLFLDLYKQIQGETKEIDLIKYRVSKDNFEYEKYCINMINIGFDCNVVDVAKKIKNLSLMSGSIAYLIGIMVMFIKMKGAHLQISFKDGKIFSDELLLIAIANGCYCGGGIKAVPRASVNDQYMDVSLIKQCSRNKFIKLFPKFKKGVHLADKEAENLVIYSKEKKLSIKSKDGDLMFSVDGELGYAEKIDFEIIPKALKFVVPKK